MFICQQEFFSRAAKSLEDAMHGLPVGTARKTEKSIEQFVRSGGPDPESAAHAMSANRESFRVTVDLSAKVGPGASTVPPSRMPQVGNMHIGNEAAAPSSYTPPTVISLLHALFCMHHHPFHSHGYNRYNFLHDGVSALVCAP